jgi:hypothetical protein
MTSTDGSDANAIQSCQNNAPSEVKLIIHHQLPGIELVSPVYACDSATCYLLPEHSVDAGSTAKVGFSINFSQKLPVGILMYELKRKDTKQPNKNAISSEDDAKCIRLVMVWKANGPEEFLVVSRLIEHDKGYIWNINRLMKLAIWHHLYDLQNSVFELTYLMHDNSVLMKRMNTTREGECYKLEMTISEGSMKDDTWRPYYIAMNR